MIRAVVDTNVLVSGLISPHSYPRRVAQYWQEGKFISVTSPDVVREVDRVLHSPHIQRKYHLFEEEIQTFVATLTYKSVCTQGKLILHRVAADPDDDKIISCAVEGQADYLVTGDKLLLQMRQYGGIRIVNAEEFIRVLEKSVD
jgi:hypothetical protein